MKIVIIGGFKFPYGDAVAARYRTLSLALTEAGHSVTVISQLPHHPRQADMSEGGGYSFAGVRYFSALLADTTQKSYLKSATNILRAVLSSCKILQRIINQERIDIVFYQGSFCFYSLPVMLVARRNRIPIINEIMDWYSPFTFFGGVAHPLAWDHELCMRLVNRYFDGVIVISSFLKEYYEQRGLKTLLVPSVLEYPIVLPAQSMSARPVFGYFGRPTRKDGIYELIAAFRILAQEGLDFEVLIAGDDGRGGNLSRIRALVRDDPLLARRISLLGQVPQQDVPKIFEKCTALVLCRPSGRFAEAGLPQKLAEYMSMARPVIVTSVGDIPQYVRDGRDGTVVAPGNVAEFARALKLVAQLPDLGYSMGISAWKRGRDIFGVSNHIPRISGFLASIVNESKYKH